MKTPIIVSENGDILIFPTVEEACAYLEPIDVRNGEYIAYDSDGQLLELKVSLEKTKNIFGINFQKERVSINSTLTEDKEGLIARLENFLVSVSKSEIDNGSSLPDLIRATSALLDKSETPRN